MLGLGFLNPLLLWGLPLAAVPIVIHLLNRRRFQTVRWAAMEFLLRAMKRNRRRLRMEQWLILLLRTLAVLFLIFLVSRPQLSGSALGAARQHHVVCVDDSASMAHRTGAGSAFDDAKDAIGDLVTRLANDNVGDLLTILRSSRPTRPDLAAVGINASLPARIRDVTAGWNIGAGVFDTGELLETARRLATENPEAPNHEFYVITDFRRRDWLTSDGKPDAAAAKWFTELTPGKQRANVIVVGSKDSENTAVTDVRCTDRVMTIGIPLSFAIDVQNRGLSASAASEVTVALFGPDSYREDGVAAPRSQVVHPVPPLQPGETATVAISQTFYEPGFHGLTASTPADRYGTDDGRSLAFDVRAASKVWLVDGDPGDEPDEAETHYVSIAYEVNDGIDPRVLPDHELGGLSDDDWASVDLIWMCNVARPDPAIVPKLEEFVRSGGGLVISLGNQVDIAHYNATLYRSGQGLLPAELLEVRGDMDDPVSVHLTAKDHPVFARYTELFELLFGKQVLVGRYVGMADDPNATHQTLLRIEDVEGDPLFIAKNYEQGGQVFVLGTTADTHWTNMQQVYAFAPMCSEAHRTAARPQDSTAFNKSPFETYVATLDPGVYRHDAVAIKPDTDPRTFSGEADAGQAVELEIPMAELSGYGVFGVMLTQHGGRREIRTVARNPILREGELEKLTESSFVRTYPDDIGDRVTVIEKSGEANAVELAGSGGVWRWLAGALLFGLLLETVLAWRFGRR